MTDTVIDTAPDLLLSFHYMKHLPLFHAKELHSVHLTRGEAAMTVRAGELSNLTTSLAEPTFVFMHTTCPSASFQQQQQRQQQRIENFAGAIGKVYH